MTPTAMAMRTSPWCLSLGWEFDRNNWNRWREITIHVADDANLDKTLHFDHDVWDHTGNCPVHGVGVVAVGMGGPDTRTSVSFDRASYRATEGGDPATVTVLLSPAPQNRVVIPIDHSGLDGASSSDYSVDPSNVTFQSGETRQSFTVTATDDEVDDDDEKVELSFGTLPPGYRDGSQAVATVNLIDDDDPEVSVSFDESSYEVTEGGAAATVVVELSADPERTLTIPMDTTHVGGASPSDYRGIPSSVTFRSGEQQKSFTVTAVNDAVDDDGESVRMSFGTLPDSRVSSGSPATATVTIADDDERGVEVSPHEPADRRGFHRELYGGVDLAADRRCDGDRGRGVGRRVGGVACGQCADIHDQQLEPKADGAGEGGGGSRLDRRSRGDADQQRQRRRLRRRVGGERDRHRGRGRRIDSLRE